MLLDSRYSMLATPSRGGFTLVELMVSIAILAVIFALGLSFDPRSFRRATLEAERDALVGVLAVARAKALGNVNQSDHGVFLSAGSYTLFEGDSHASRDAGRDADFSRGEGTEASGPSEIVFRSPDGSASSAVIFLRNETKSIPVEINSEGAILW